MRIILWWLIIMGWWVDHNLGFYVGGVTYTWIDDDDVQEPLEAGVGGMPPEANLPQYLGASELLVPRNHGRPSACIWENKWITIAILNPNPFVLSSWGNF
jgi:hypothetical protein